MYVLGKNTNTLCNQMFPWVSQAMIIWTLLFCQHEAPGSPHTFFLLSSPHGPPSPLTGCYLAACSSKTPVCSFFLLVLKWCLPCLFCFFRRNPRAELLGSGIRASPPPLIPIGLFFLEVHSCWQSRWIITDPYPIFSPCPAEKLSLISTPG